MSTRQLKIAMLVGVAWFLLFTANQVGAEKITLRFAIAHDIQTFNQIKNTFIANFVQKYPNIKIKGEPVPWDQFQEKYLPQVAAGTAPDVFGNIHFTWAQRWIREGFLLNLSPYIQRSHYDLTDFFPAGLAPYRYKGNQYGLPFDLGAEILFINRDMFREVGLPYPDMDTWDLNTFLDYCLKLSRDTTGDGKIDEWGFGTPPLAHQMIALIYVAGGEFVNEDETECLITKPESMKALLFWAYDLIHQYKVATSIADRQALRSLGGIFISGKVGMTPAGGWMMPKYTKTCKFKWDVLRYPKGPKGRLAFAMGAAAAINARTRHPEEAWRFVSEFTSADGEKMWMLPLGASPPRKSVFSLLMQKWMQKPGMPEHVEMFEQALQWDAIAPRPIGPMASRILDAFQTQLELLELGKKPVREVAQTVKEEVDRLLAQQK